MKKVVKGLTYNFVFDCETGFFARWGKTHDDDPLYSPGGPEIADIEISTICSGPFGKRCTFCYKNDTALIEKNMSLKTFQTIIEKINPKGFLCQVALGVGDVDANPDLVPILRYCRENKVVPNITVNGARLEEIYEGITYAEHIAKYCGAVSVSNYDDNLCFNAIKRFTDLGMKQVNIHQLLSSQTIDKCIDLLDKVLNDSRLEKLNAVVFLSYKNKTKCDSFSLLQDDVKYNELINKAFEKNISIGFDSCGASRFIEAIKGRNNYKDIIDFVEPCESGLFSIYVNTDGYFYPCSFTESIGEWKNGIDIVNCDDFMKDVWFSDRVVEWRNKLLKNNRNCPVYKV